MNFSPIAATADNPRVAALQLYGRQLANAYIYLGSRATYSRELETWLIALLSGGTPTAAQLATIDQIAQAYLYLEDVRQEVLRCIADPSLTVADLVPPDPNATRPYTRAAIWNGIPWATKDDLATVSGIDANSLAQLQAMLNAWPTPRTNCPVVSADYTLLPTDAGCIMSVPGLTVTLPSVASKLPGTYLVKNGSLGEGYTIPAGSDLISFVTQTSTGTYSREIIEFGGARDFDTDTTNNNWFTS
jgi:hypothetical protein